MGKVEEFNIENDIIEMMKRQVSFSEMERTFKRQGVNVSRRTITRWVDDNPERVARLDKNLKEVVVTSILDLGNYLLDQNKKTESILNRAIEIHDNRLALLAQDRIFKNIELYDRLVGTQKTDLTPAQLRDFLAVISPRKREKVLSVLVEEE